MKNHRTISALAAVAIAGTAAASPRETITLTNQNLNGLHGDASNTVLTPTLSGGYTLGRITYSGTLTSLTAATWRSDARIELVAPGGQSVVIRPFLDGSTYTSAAFSGSVFFQQAVDPAGIWTVRLYETFDDGGAAIVDSRVTATITTTDDPPAPPAATDLGTLTAAGLNGSVASLPRGQTAWFTFVVPSHICFGGPNFVDLDTFGSVTQITSPQHFADDTVLALYDSLGNLVAWDDDDCNGLSSQLSFGAGTGVRAPVGNGQPFTGAEGSLPPGRYYAAVAAVGNQFQNTFWRVTTASAQITSPVVFSVRSNVGLVPACNADQNCDGFLDFFDADAFVLCFEGTECVEGRNADYNGDGFVDFFDADAFVVDFEAGC